MKTFSRPCLRLSQTFTFLLFVLLLCAVPAFCQSGPPPPPPFPVHAMAFYPLETPPWGDWFGLPARGFTNVNVAPSWDYAGTALSVDTNLPAYVQEEIFLDGHTNMRFETGSFSLWFQGNWTSTADGGTGPTNWAALFCVGNWSANAAESAWAIAISPSGTNLVMEAQCSGSNQVVFNVPIDFDAGDFHFLTVTYSLSNCCVYLEGQLVTNTGPIIYYPSSSDCTNYGMFFGSLSTAGDCQCHGQLQWLATYDYPLSADAVASDYTEVSGYITYWGGSLPASGGFYANDSPPSPPGGGDGSGGSGGSPQTTNSGPSYSDTDFWLAGLPPGTNAYNSNPNAVTFILHATTNTSSYQLQTMASLTGTNWTPQQIFIGASGQNWTPITFPKPVLSTLFFRAINYSQDSTDSGLPDWWKLQNGLNPNSLSSSTNGVSDAYAEPAGDGWSDLQKFENGWNPSTFYTPPAPMVTVAPLSGDNGVLITWEPSQGNVIGYTILRNGVTLAANLPASQLSYQDNMVSVSPYSMPSYQVQANYSDQGQEVSSPLSIAQTPQNQNMALDTALLRGPQGQYYLAAPNIPNTVTNLRIYAEPQYSEYPNFTFDIYSQPMTNFNSSPGAVYLDFPPTQFTNGLAPLPRSFLPYYNANYLICVPMGSNGTFGPFAYVMLGFFQQTAQNSSWYNTEFSDLVTEPFPGNDWGNFMPFLDGTVQLRQNLIFQLEAADQDNALQFSVADNGDTRPTVFPMNGQSDVFFLGNYAWANFHMRNGNSVALVNEFKPFEDNDFYRNFIVQSSGDLNTNGSLASGVHYVGGGPSPPPPPYNVGYSIQIPNKVPFAFPDYAYAASGTTNPVSPLLSTNSQLVFSSWPGEGAVGVTQVDSTHRELATGQTNLFGLPYQSVSEYYSDGHSHYLETLAPGQVVLDVAEVSNYPSFFYAQVQAPQIDTVGYYFGVADRDYLPGDAGFTPTTVSGPMIATPGVPLLIGAWAEQSVNGSTNWPGFIEQYFDKAYMRDNFGDVTTNQTGVLSEYGEFFPTDPGAVVLTTKTNVDGTNGSVNVQVIGLYTDRNHDGTIDTSFSGPDFCTPARPFQFWVNDDNDSGDTGGDDVPGEPAAKHQVPNGLSGIVNGVRDLNDFFPVYVDVGPVLQQMQTNAAYASLQFRLSQADGAISYVETTTLTTNAPLAYLTDTNQAFLLSDVVVTQVTSTGVYLSETFLTNILNGGGIILAEASTNTTSPLVLDILQDGYILAEAQLPLNISGVEQMFRHKNLTSAVLGQIDGPPDRLTPADVPNALDDSGTNFIFLHGYNVNPTQARGWEAEMFKRLYWSGSHARFYGVTWCGYLSQENILGLAQFTPNYQTNVYNAFLTTPYLASFLNGFTGANNVAAHSLGNIVVLSALNDWGANVQNYFMIDAAVPGEAIDVSAALSTNMVYQDWIPYNGYLWADEWYQLFPTNDYRSTLNWTGRVANFNNAQVYNLYSSGEEVLRTWPGGYPPSTLFGIIFNQIQAYIQGQTGFYAWSWQEIMKGRMDSTLHNSILSSDHGGWRFNSAYSSLTVSQANALPSSQLKTNAFFDFSAHTNFTADLALQGSGGSTYAQANRNRILSDAIPAITLPVGANSMPRLRDLGQEFNMQVNENNWPPSRLALPEINNWHHSDIREVAYTYTLKAFDQIVNKGNLK